MSIETGVLLGEYGEPLWWHMPQDRSAGHIGDDKQLWNMFWDLRAYVTGFAHSHPGGGIQYPSGTDVTTFAAIEAGLGRRLDWWIITADSAALYRWDGHNYVRVNRDPPWVAVLRTKSNY